MSDVEPRPVPKLLIWGLVGGFVLFVCILVGIVLGRERGDPAPTPSGSSSESPQP
ncbi:MAG: hypothetical protein ACKV2T_09510 [Kofleriaceae bacterium]